MPDDTHPPLTAARFRELFASGPFDEATVLRLVPYYTDDVVFTDPIQTVRGLDAFIAMNRRLLSRAKEIRFEVRDMAESGDQIFVTWVMTMRAKLPAPVIRVEGVTHVTLRDGKVAVHKDYWDLLGSVMDTIPIVGTIYRAIVGLFG